MGSHVFFNERISILCFRMFVKLFFDSSETNRKTPQSNAWSCPFPTPNALAKDFVDDLPRTTSNVWGSDAATKARILSLRGGCAVVLQALTLGNRYNSLVDYESDSISSYAALLDLAKLALDRAFALLR